jgi:hypothetical protein
MPYIFSVWIKWHCKASTEESEFFHYNCRTIFAYLYFELDLQLGSKIRPTTLRPLCRCNPYLKRRNSAHHMSSNKFDAVFHNILFLSWLYKSCWNNLVSCNKSDSVIKLVTWVVNSLFQTCYNNWEQAVRTQLVDSLWTDFWQLVCIPVPTCAFFVCKPLRLLNWPSGGEKKA